MLFTICYSLKKLNTACAENSLIVYHFHCQRWLCSSKWQDFQQCPERLGSEVRQTIPGWKQKCNCGSQLGLRCTYYFQHKQLCCISIYNTDANVLNGLCWKLSNFINLFANSKNTSYVRRESQQNSVSGYTDAHDSFCVFFIKYQRVSQRVSVNSFYHVFDSKLTSRDNISSTRAFHSLTWSCSEIPSFLRIYCHFNLS